MCVCVFVCVIYQTAATYFMKLQVLKAFILSQFNISYIIKYDYCMPGKPGRSPFPYL